MKILVTGGAGYIGSVAVERLHARGDDVVVLDNLWRGHAPALPANVRLHQVDIRNAAEIDRVLGAEKPDAVMHFAAATIVPESVSQPGLYYAINTAGTLNLLNSMERSGVDRFVFSSTAATYGIPAELPITERTPTNPINPYGSSKLMVEQMVRWIGEATGLKSFIFRYFNVAGATEICGEDHHPETHVIPAALQAALGLRPSFSVFGTDYDTPDGTAIRDYVHVIDLVDAHLLALDRLSEPLGVFNLGTKGGFSVRQIVEGVEQATGRPLNVEYGPRRAGDPPVLLADSSRAREVLGWQPQHSTLEQMIGSAWNWMRRNPQGYGA